MIIFIIVGFLCIVFFSPSAHATYTPPGGKNNDVQYKNGFGYAGSDNFVANGTNVGIGSTNPGQALDVQGTVRSTAFIGNGAGLTGISVAGGWTASGNNAYETSSGNVGIGTSAFQTAFAVANGNVGIGTWTAAGGNLIVNGGGNVGIGSAWPGQMLDVNGTIRNLGQIINGNIGIGTSFVNGTGEGAMSVMNGNVGIGTWVPGATLDVVGNIRASTVSTVNITSTPYTITSSQNGIYFTYTDAAAGTINLPALSGLSAGFTVTIARQVPQSLTIAANGSDTFPNALSSLEMRGNNIATITLMKAGSFWNIVNQTADCIVGQACWYSNMIYAGTLNGHQYFTTPGGCNNSATPTCSGTDSLTLAYSPTGTLYGATDEYYGKVNTSTLNGQTGAAAAQFCYGMTYDGNSDNDWYLPAKAELNLLYQNRVTIGGFYTLGTSVAIYYWSSTEYNTANAWTFVYSYGYMSPSSKTVSDYVRCVRRY